MFFIISVNKINLCKINEEYNKEILGGKKTKTFYSFSLLLNIWKMKSIAKVNCEMHKLVNK